MVNFPEQSKPMQFVKEQLRLIHQETSPDPTDREESQKSNETKKKTNNGKKVGNSQKSAKKIKKQTKSKKKNMSFRQQRKQAKKSSNYVNERIDQIEKTLISKAKAKEIVRLRNLCQ